MAPLSCHSPAVSMMALRWSPPALSGAPAAQFVYAGMAVWPAAGCSQSHVWLAAAVPASPPVSTRPSQHTCAPSTPAQAVRASSFSAALWMDAIVAPICVQKAAASS